MIAFLSYLFRESIFYLKLGFDVAACFSLLWCIFRLIDEVLCGLLFRRARHQAAGWRFMLILTACVAGFRSALAVWCKGFVRDVLLPSQPTISMEMYIGNILAAVSVIWAGCALFRLIIYIRRRYEMAKFLRLLPYMAEDAVFARASAETGINPVCKVWHGADGISVFGIHNPIMIVPDDFNGRYSDEERYYLYLHELAHICRRDALINFLTDICEIIFWIFPPLVYEMRRQRECRELCCDIAVLIKHQAVEPVRYGELLLREIKTANSRVLVGFSGQRYRQVRARLDAVIGNTKILSIKKLAVYLFAGALLVLQCLAPVNEMPYQRVVSIITTDGDFNTVYFEEGEIDRQDREQLIERVYADYDKRDISQIVVQYPKFHFAGLFGYYLSSDNEKLLPEEK